MKKITLLAIIISFVYNLNAQNSCTTATSITAGTHSVGTINGTAPTLICDSGTPGTKGEWYAYTASNNGYADISTYLPSNAGKDTNMFIYSGNCGSLNCLASSDDLSPSIYLSRAQFPISIGETYYISFDNRWSTSGFDFNITETEVTCTNGTPPLTEDFSNWSTLIACWDEIDSNLDNYKWVIQDLDGGNPSLVSESYSSASSNPNGFLNPDNWIISYPIDLRSYPSNFNIELTWKARGYNSNLANEYYSVYAATNNQTSDFESSPVKFSENIGQNGGAGVYANKTMDLSPLAGNIIYIAFRHHNMSAPQYKITIDDIQISANSLGINDIDFISFKHFYDKNTQVLTLKSNNATMKKIDLFNILGQNVLNKNLNQVEENLNLSRLSKGIYIAQISFENTTKTIKFIKQ